MYYYYQICDQLFQIQYIIHYLTNICNISGYNIATDALGSLLVSFMTILTYSSQQISPITIPLRSPVDYIYVVAQIKMPAKVQRNSDIFIMNWYEPNTVHQNNCHYERSTTRQKDNISDNLKIMSWDKKKEGIHEYYLIKTNFQPSYCMYIFM